LFASCPLLSGRDETDPAAVSCGVFQQRQTSQARQMAVAGVAAANAPEMPQRRRTAREEAVEYAL
jgi:LysR family transcriptional regulator for bpeEF and oprC